MSAEWGAGQWIALIDGELASSGPTPEAAAQASGAVRPGQSLVFSFREASSEQPLPLSPLLEKLRPLLDRRVVPVYLVGGALRDALLQRVSHDLDFAVPDGAIALAFAIGNALRLPAFALDEDRDVGRVIVPDLGTTIDIARFRGPDLASDLRGRDFTMNALAIPATARDAGSIIDPLGGLDDIVARQIRVVSDNSFADDPVRALRALRQANELGFSLTAATDMALRRAAPAVNSVSSERVRDELVRLLTGARPHHALQQLSQTGLLAITLPEVAALAGVAQSPPHHEPVLEHTVSVLRWLESVEEQIKPATSAGDDALRSVAALLAPYQEALLSHFARSVEGGQTGHGLLRLGALFHDTGKPATQTVEPGGRIRFLGHDDAGAKLAAHRLRALAFSNEAVDYVSRVTRDHMRPLSLASSDSLPSRRAIYRFYRTAGPAGIDVALLALADHLATYDGPGEGAAWRRLLDVAGSLLAAYFTAYDDIVRPVRLITGSELIAELDLQPGREVGRLLREIEEAQAAGQIASREEALSLARQLRGDEQKAGG